jgi:putative nucleotidyltransferase with HDIG domain
VSDAATTLARAPVDETGLIEEARERRGRGMSRRELTVAILRSGGFVLMAGLLFTTPTSRSPSLEVVAGLVVAYAVLWRVELETGAGSAIPTQLALMPMAALLPGGWIPAAVGVGAVLSELTVRGHVGRRVFGALGFSWSSVGLAMVILAAGEPTPTIGHAYVYALAVVAYGLADGANVYLHQWLVVGLRTGRLDGVFRAWTFEALFAPIGFVSAIASLTVDLAFLIPLTIVALVRLLTLERTSHVTKTVELSHAYRGTALLLGTVIDADDGYTGFHSRGVVDLAVQVAKELRLGAGDLRRTEFAALLHDVGKIRIPKEIINKPGPLTPDEWTIIRRHPGEGAEMLEHVGGFLAEIGEIVRHHHEKWDGTGYPDGLAGEAIPIIARIVAVCDAFSAITTDRAYRKGRSVEFALGELRDFAGTQFDPRVVGALCAVMEREDGTVPAPVENVA